MHRLRNVSSSLVNIKDIPCNSWFLHHDELGYVCRESDQHDRIKYDTAVIMFYDHQIIKTALMVGEMVLPVDVLISYKTADVKLPDINGDVDGAM